jgi:multidrug resistance efflux pump
MAFRLTDIKRSWILAVLGVAALAGAFFVWRHLSPRESTDDAQVAAHV